MKFGARLDVFVFSVPSTTVGMIPATDRHAQGYHAFEQEPSPRLLVSLYGTPHARLVSSLSILNTSLCGLATRVLHILPSRTSMPMASRNIVPDPASMPSRSTHTSAELTFAKRNDSSPDQWQPSPKRQPSKR
ncbi:uncharacterized protein BT62DRAFT_1009115 [Guyanagaster necrorhizus]|uniref:Uncharacterized protein n=1 Tax=Guyanagaster necrorhizus TaxID=856835 RepID=A0A9P7VMB1_9AGAR|nr:uncharacterized protein BT62DRAFT_1009115 [Guyanagaster necrorhizus MCA 3950]KAG7443334.1 hypothetical protein BT62DRAFT_1009115 [Guyanagaster necrorhizus MCA 3950]